MQVFTTRDEDSEFCQKLFYELLSRSQANAVHLKFVIEYIPSFDASQVQLSELLKKQLTDERSFETLIGMGMVVQKADIETAVNLLPETCVNVLRLLILKFNCSSPDFDEVCKKAILADKVRFAACLVYRGAVSSHTAIQILLKVLKLKPGELDIHSLTKLCRPDDINLGILITDPDLSLTEHPNGLELIKLLLDAGMDPNGNGKENPIAVIWELKLVAPERKIDFICLFLSKGAKCSLLTNPLHVAAQLAVEAGMNMCVPY